MHNSDFVDLQMFRTMTLEDRSFDSWLDCVQKFGYLIPLQVYRPTLSTRGWR